KNYILVFMAHQGCSLKQTPPWKREQQIRGTPLNFDFHLSPPDDAHPVALTSTKSDARRQSGDYLTMRYGNFRRIRRTIPICVLYRPTSMGMSYKRRLSCGGSGFRFPGTDFLPDGLRGQAFRHDGKLPFDLLSGILAFSLFEIDLRGG